MNTYHYAPDLKIGDLIAISYSTGLGHGIFAGHGRNTIQYYMPSHIVRKNGIDRKFYITYVKDNKWRICKISPDILNEEDRANYEKAIEILKINK